MPPDCGEQVARTLLEQSGKLSKPLDNKVYRGPAREIAVEYLHQETAPGGYGLSMETEICSEAFPVGGISHEGRRLLVEPFVGGIELGDNNIKDLHLSYRPVANPGMDHHTHVGFQVDQLVV